MTRTEIAESLFGPLTSKGNGTFCMCPGDGKHTHPSGERDCRLYGLEGGVPTIYCAHKSCKAEIVEANYRLRSAVGKAECGTRTHSNSKTVIGTWEPPSRTKALQLADVEAEQSAINAASAIPAILDGFGWDFADTAPIPTDPTDQYEAFLRLWQPDAWLWIGANKWSGSWCKCAWATAADWIMKGPSIQGVQTSFCSYKPNSLERTNANVLTRPFLVFESDSLEKPVQAAIINWIRSPLGLGLPLRMVCDTGGKSLHAWFDALHLTPSDFATLKPILTGHRMVCQTPIYGNKPNTHPGLGGDPAMFVLSQPVRLPGPMRPDTTNRQRIVWLAPSPTNP